MATASLIALTIVAGALPDAIDHLRSADVVPNVGLVLDASCSMRYNPRIHTNCTWWANQYNGGSLSFTKNQVMRAVLTGCQSADDGILDKWQERVNFSIFQFGHSTNRAALVAPFDSSLETLQAGAMSIPAASNTPMSLAIGSHAYYFRNHFTESNTLQCRPNFLLLLSDGNPNGPNVNYRFNCPTATEPVTNKYVRWYKPWDGSEYLTEHEDFLCDVDGNQQIRTYAIGFGAPGSFSPSNLQSIAQHGGGEYYYASDVQQLDAAFTQIITSMASRAGLFYAAPAVQIEGLFSDNVVYTSAFRPAAQGPWYGTVKKHCIQPRTLNSGLFDPSDVSCIFKSESDGKTLLTNPAAVDMWTGSATTAATTGGAGAVISAQLGLPGGPPATPYWPRNIRTWRPGNANYQLLKKNAWNNHDTWTSKSEHNKLINKLHGYTYNAANNGNPIAVAEWPLGDPVHSTTILLRYGPNCEVAGQCFVVIGMNDGMLHFLDAATGQETTALVPAEAWQMNRVGNEQLRNMIKQPDVDTTHRYFVDGGIVRFHDDNNGDGIIQRTETAYLIFGLGRGGAGYYQIPINEFNGELSNGTNAIRPLLHTHGTAFEELQDTWAAPWAGEMMVQGQLRNVAVFPSGHIRQFDEPTSPTPRLAPKRVDPLPGTPEEKCAPFLAALGVPGSTCNQRTNSGYPDPAPQDITFGPYASPDTIAYRVHFASFQLEDADRLEIRDGQGRIVDVMSGGLPNNSWSEWIYDDKFEMRWITNGVQTHHKGFKIHKIRMRKVQPRGDREHNPTIFVVDLDKWNGASPRRFVRDAEDGGLLLRISRQCVGTTTGICIDEDDSPDLANMTCPISAEVSAYTVNGLVESLYWGDECGQLWKAYATETTEGVTWKARRLLSLNNALDLSDQTVSR